MPIRPSLLCLVPILFVAACGSGALTSEEIQQAAIERARTELGLPADTPLEAEIWASEGDREDVIFCGTISGQGEGSQVTPQRFAATATEPIRWIVFEEAHNPLLDTGEDRVPDWVNLCEPGNDPQV